MIVLISFVLMTVSLEVAASDFVVESPAGKFQGQELTASNKQTYVGFQGIPYAKPPVGELRFAKPEPHPRIDGVFDATEEIAVCPQPHIAKMIDGEDLDEEFETEDCLQLNIFMKQLDLEKNINKKVLIFIHGGGFVMGTARHLSFGTLVTEQDIIVVSINYRLGIFGFLSTENEASHGNFGMWDQALALKWIKDNIASFGGDPDDVTISGESAGGASVGILSISPMTKGLFTKAFLMSGTATSGFANALHPHLSALKLAQSTGCWDGETDKMVGQAQSKTILKCLRERPVSDFTKYPISDFGRPTFVPHNDGTFIPSSPFKLMGDDKYLKSVGFFDRLYVVSFTNNEKGLWDFILKFTTGAIMQMEDKTEEEKAAILSGNKADLRKIFLGVRMGMDEPPEYLLDKIIDWYERRFGNTAINELANDFSFIIPTFDFVDALARQKSKNVHLMYINHYPSFMKGDNKGMVHGVDLLYWIDVTVKEFGKVYRIGMQGDFADEDFQLKALFSSVIAEFVKTGNPLSSALKTKLPSGWPAYDIDNHTYLDFSNDPLVRYHLERERWKLWSELVPRWIVESKTSDRHTEL